MAVNRTNDEVIFEIVSRLGVMAEYQTGWTKELNLVAWNGAAPKFDIRDWNPEHDHMSRGITLHEEEARKLGELLAERFDLRRAEQALAEKKEFKADAQGSEANAEVSEKEKAGDELPAENSNEVVA